MQLTKNIGNIDRMARFGLGILFLVLAVFGTLGLWAWLVGIVLIGTAALNFCPAYRVLGVNTCSTG